MIGGPVFEVREAEGFSGTLDFSGHHAALDGWFYELDLSDGSGTIRGQARIVEDKLTTDKVFADPDEVKQARIRETFERVERDVFWTKLAEATASPPPPEASSPTRPA